MVSILYRAGCVHADYCARNLGVSCHLCRYSECRGALGAYGMRRVAATLMIFSPSIIERGVGSLPSPLSIFCINLG